MNENTADENKVFSSNPVLMFRSPTVGEEVSDIGNIN
jgi:hypothetical protein